MRRWVHLVCAGALALALLSILAPPGSSAQAATAPPASGAGQSQDVRVGDDGSLTLAANAPPAPPVYGTFQHFGLAISSAQQFSTPFRSIRIDYDASAPRGDHSSQATSRASPTVSARVARSSSASRQGLPASCLIANASRPSSGDQLG